LVGDNVKSTARDSTASQGVFQHTQTHAVAARRRAQFSHVSDRNATVFRHHKRLSFSCEAVHFINDGLFLTAIQTQDLLLNMHLDQFLKIHPSARLLISDQLFRKNPMQRGRHLRWSPAKK
jgi:hypothetical protein